MLSSSWWSYIGLPPVRLCFSCIRIRHSVPDVTSPIAKGKDPLSWLTGGTVQCSQEYSIFLVARAHCSLMFNLVFTRTPRCFSVKLFPTWYNHHGWCWSWLFPGSRVLVELYKIPVSQPVQSSRVLLDGQWMSHSSPQCHVLCKFTEDALYPIVQIGWLSHRWEKKIETMQLLLPCGTEILLCSDIFGFQSMI